ncbi:MAG: hypothetical protein HXS52_01300 [Theionarchaea archaeon]|nr:hypothetical protein [Theionarchaea archaeon]MBU7036539.1 hypothetical protein [Theionarchaea archaeon]
MKSEHKMSIGAVMASIGSLVLVLSLLVGPMDLGRPLDFLMGFGVGLCTGLGLVLSINGLIERRREKESL